ncbi:enterochelin esterase-like enzyme [Paenarthrobacter nitroguajacolicus]|uniref:alpha/beta hydrolase n=1 Tax=Paenarthrobacter nitroguajacolicus TaxID=211146 RepID=UPI00285A0B98|nr:alpha/beta hydrolase-fold protein [Paenarthrobacter nitroguajacolicus]MDR6985695.1 enterochelin esterase-like enzyme [Paenarthrobacter nitroguajacolicus]
MDDLLKLEISGPVVMTVAGAVGVAFFLVLFLRPSARWALTAVTAIAAAALLGWLTVWLVEDVMDVFHVGLTPRVWFWAIACFAALGLAVASFRHSSRWRKVVASIAIPVFVLVAALGINTEFGLNKTLGSALGISTESAIQLNKPNPDASIPAGPLWQNWKPPAAMPAKGQVGTQVIPATASGFNARPAGIYLPPAALTDNPPRLPLFVLMMGQPGLPDPQYVSAALDGFAAKNNGLAPIAIVADQIGPDENDTLCLDTAKYGNVEKYINEDVVNWAKANLNILPDREHWTIAGYSNGGQCAISFAVKYPTMWGNVVDISGEEFPGAEDPAGNLAEIFGGNQADYDAQKPINIMKGKQFPDTTAVFTVGSDDVVYVAAAKAVSAAARAAGMTVTYYEVPNGGHVGLALNAGLTKGFEVLYPRLGLSR